MQFLKLSREDFRMYTMKKFNYDHYIMIDYFFNLYRVIDQKGLRYIFRRYIGVGYWLEKINCLKKNIEESGDEDNFNIIRKEMKFYWNNKEIKKLFAKTFRESSKDFMLFWGISVIVHELEDKYKRRQIKHNKKEREMRSHNGKMRSRENKEKWLAIRSHLNIFEEEYLNSYLIDLYDAIAELEQFYHIEYYDSRCNEEYYYQSLLEDRREIDMMQCKQDYYVFCDIKNHEKLAKHLKNPQLQKFIRDKYKGKSLDAKQVKYYILIFGLKSLNKKMKSWE